MGKFIYPFNFVAFPKSNNGKGDILPPITSEGVSLKAFHGLSGTLTLRLNPLTPLAIPDTSKVVVEPDGHKRYPFVSRGDQLTIPGTALKGMARSVFEALTNSCFSQMPPEPVRYRRRVTGLDVGDGELQRSDQSVYVRADFDPLRKGLAIKADQSVKPGIIKRGENGDLYIKPMAWVYLTDYLPKTSLIPKETINVIAEIKEGRVKYLKDSDKGDEAYRKNAFSHLSSYHGKRVTLTVSFESNTIPSWLSAGTEYYLSLDPGHSKNHWGRVNEITKVDLKPFPKSFMAKYVGLTANKLLFEVTGYLRVAGWMDRKHGDFVFVEMHEPGPVVPVDGFADAYKQANKDNPFKLQELSEGATVWYQTRKKFGFGVDHVQAGFAQIFPFVSPFSLQEKIVKSHPTCDDPNRLCPACNLFGLAGKESWSGRVRVGDMIYLGRPVLQSITLKELSSPRSGYELFYLKPATESGASRRPSGKQVQQLEKDLAALFGLHGEEEKEHKKKLRANVKPFNDYLDSFSYGRDVSVARGRKFYLHHGKRFQLSKAQDNGEEGKERRATVEVVHPNQNGYFTGRISFRNLRPWELGLLLISLSPPWGGDGNVLAHKLGMGRPLGLGSVKVDVSDTCIESPQGRFSAWDHVDMATSRHNAIECQILGHLWLIQQFLPGQEAVDVVTEIQKAASHSMLEMLRDQIADKAQLDLSAIAHDEWAALFQVTYQDISPASLQAAGSVFKGITISVPQDFDKRIDRVFGNTSDGQVQESLISLLDQRDVCEQAAAYLSQSLEMTDVALKEALAIAERKSATVFHVNDLVTLLKWDPLSFPARLSIRYPQTAAKDIRPWFNTNFRPLPLPNELAQEDEWTLED